MEIAARDIMLDFAERTGLLPQGTSPERYLWTDAFAVCNLLGLYRQTGDERLRELALLLVGQVHSVLGRYRSDDSRTGWISGLGEEEGKRHPTRGGLRIGKKLAERGPGEPFDEALEWERDGQYFHYLTQWMHALDCVSRVTGEIVYNRWALELAAAAHAGFAYTPVRGGPKRLYWKMSIDLTYPLVPSMGHHDPLDGLVTYAELRAGAAKLSGRPESRELEGEIADMALVCEGVDWATDDSLGIGGLLLCAYRMALLIAEGGFTRSDLLRPVLEDSLMSLKYFGRSSPLRQPAAYRLAFREFGLSIGLQAIGRLESLIGRYPAVLGNASYRTIVGSLMKYVPLADQINAFWLEESNRKSKTWSEHRNINMVMLTASLAPDGYLLPS